MWSPMQKWRLGVLIGLGSVLGGCATMQPPHGTGMQPPRSPGCQDVEESRLPPYQGKENPWKIHVVQIHIPKEDIEHYKELAEKRVGFGLSNILVETLVDTNRFVFLEEKAQILKRLVELWEVTTDGIFVRPATPALQTPDFLVYAEIFDFVACSPVDIITPLHKRLTCLTSVGVQVRIANTLTGEYVPGSTSPPWGVYCHTVHLPLFGPPALAFDQSAVGQATLKATRSAVLQALQRFDKKEW